MVQYQNRYIIKKRKYAKRKVFVASWLYFNIILMSAGCTIGLGNVWRFPYIVGKYGEASFVLIYILPLIVLFIFIQDYISKFS